RFSRDWSSDVCSSDLDPARLLVAVGARAGPGSLVTVDITYDAPTDVPLVGRLIGDVRLHARAVMRVEVAASPARDGSPSAGPTRSEERRVGKEGRGGG